MTIQEQLQTVTEDLEAARLAHMEAEVKRHVCRRMVARAEATLAIARVTLMARHDAGTNDTARRAYAERETVDEREILAFHQAELDDAEIAHIETTARLRVIEDRRRYLETMVALTNGRASELAIRAAYANGDDAASFRRYYDEDGNELPF